jgi:flagellar assembly factor FliW
MLEIETRQFGTLSYTRAQVIHFSTGLPGFEECRDFLLHEEAAMAPFVFLQSLADANLSFVTLPVEKLEPAYELTLSRDDLTQLAAAVLPEPDDVLCLAILQLNSAGATANLAAPIVIANAFDHDGPRRGTQAIRHDRRYSACHPVSWHGLAKGGV